ncbi:MAG: cytochrome c oxidase subunit 4 [Actinomycetales bacterium]|nr:cytochrome c oxidase subunit 4 [Actinomycetales bacterium]
MKFNGKLFYFLSAFYLLSAFAYGVWFALDTQMNAGANTSWFGFAIEPIGTAALAMLSIMSLFLGFYIAKTSKSQGPVPEDRLDANIEDGDTEIGFFAPWSWWPFFLGAFGALAFAALAIGWWLFFIAFPLALVAIIGFVFEHSRGKFAH